jgi:hypothetical protein
MATKVPDIEKLGASNYMGSGCTSMARNSIAEKASS